MIPIYECENREKIRTIHIEVTNACNLQCANCTRYVGHHRTPYFMTLDEVRRSIGSLVNFPGNVGIMGGEPTLHPEFSEILNILVELIPDISRRGLWTDGYKYEKYREQIEATFLPENIVYNSHDVDVEDNHQPLLVHPNDIGMDPSEHAKYVENCWIQKRWSASITPKGGFFCEVAAAQDMLFNGPGGYEIENNWWNKKPKDFADQVKRYCKNCSACVPMAKVSAHEKFDFVSESMVQKLLDVKSPKARTGKIQVLPLEFFERKDINDKPWMHRSLENRQQAGGEKIKD